MSLILDLIFPKNCLNCGQKSKQYFCKSCLEKQQINSLYHHPEIKNPHYQASLSIFKYNFLIRQLITQLKYDFVTDLINPLTAISTSAIKENFPTLLKYWQDNNFHLLSIPLHFYRQNWRGFNQSYLLAESLAKRLKLKFSPHILSRSKNTSIQSHLKNRQLKNKNLKNAFVLNQDKIPQNVIIFDDVATTFSTLKSALKTLSISDDLNHCYFLTLAA